MKCSHQSVGLYIPLSLLGNGLVKTLPCHTMIEELLDASFSVQSALYQGK
jgi:hypothetical protein